MVRAAIREPRVQYVSRIDQIMIGVSLLAPGLTDWLLARGGGGWPAALPGQQGRPGDGAGGA